MPIKYFRKSCLFQEELIIVLDELVAKQDMPAIMGKVVRVVNAFKTNVNPAFIPDNDSLDIKCIFDIVTDHCSYSAARFIAICFAGPLCLGHIFHCETEGGCY